MNDELNQKTSQFLDDELPHDQALALLQKMRTNAALAEKLQRYAAISHALKTEQFIALRPDFSAQISARLEAEPAYLLPRPKPAAKRSYQWLALAASVAVLSVVAVRSLPLLGQHSPNANPATLQIAQHAAMPTLPHSPVTTVARSNTEQPLNARINDYLQAHNGSAYADNQQLQSMARLTAYNQK
jgi:sigma-E factor negative regulatory protein RseA